MNEIPKGYDPSLVEDKWYAEWLKQNCFTADPSRAFNSAKKSAAVSLDLKPAYSIVIPPPKQAKVLEAKGQPIPDNDLWIAAIALEYRLPLASRDQHFQRVPKLSVWAW